MQTPKSKRKPLVAPGAPSKTKKRKTTPSIADLSDEELGAKLFPDDSGFDHDFMEELLQSGYDFSDNTWIVDRLQSVWDETALDWIELVIKAGAPIPAWEGPEEETSLMQTALENEDYSLIKTLVAHGTAPELDQQTFDLSADDEAFKQAVSEGLAMRRYPDTYEEWRNTYEIPEMRSQKER